MLKSLKGLTITLFAVTAFSCVSNEKINYLQNLEGNEPIPEGELIQYEIPEYRLQYNDIISVNIQNAEAMIEKNLKKSLKSWSIDDCNTSTYSPQSNGMREAFNGTFKRDYAYESCLDSAQIVLQKIHQWVEEYNTFTPHSPLNIKTPNEYYNFKIAV
jgi:hypothetical protein